MPPPPPPPPPPSPNPTPPPIHITKVDKINLTLLYFVLYPIGFKKIQVIQSPPNNEDGHWVGVKCGLHLKTNFQA